MSNDRVQNASQVFSHFHARASFIGSGNEAFRTPLTTMMARPVNEEWSAAVI
jgi:hypothetical protein